MYQCPNCLAADTSRTQTRITIHCAITNTQHAWVVRLIGKQGQWTLRVKGLGMRGLERRANGEKGRREQTAGRKEQGARKLVKYIGVDAQQAFSQSLQLSSV